MGCHALLQGSFQPRDWTSISYGSCTAGRFFITEPPGKPQTYIGSSNWTPCYLPKGVDSIYPHKTQHTDVCSSFIHNCYKLEAIKVLFNRWMDEKTVVHTDREILFSAKKLWAIKPWKDMEENLMHIIKQKKPVWKSHILYDFNYMTFWKSQNYKDNKKFCCYQRFGRRSDE